MEKMETHIGHIEVQLKHWGAKIDDLVGRVDLPGSVVRTEYRRGLQEMKVMHQAAQRKLDELRAAGADLWEAHKDGMQGACNELTVAYKKLK